MERINPYGQPMLLVYPPSIPPALPKTLNNQQLYKIFTAGCLCQEDRAFILLILDTGMRLGEVASIVKEDISDHTVQVSGKRGQREVPISQQVRAMLTDLGDDSHPWVSPRTSEPLTRAGVQWAYRRIFRRSGISGGAHRLRHTFATEYLRNRGSIVHLQRILGHTDIKTTQIYLDLLSSDLIEEHQRVSPAQPWLK